jgi:ribosomal protein S18 acetylase RimI-like enzyme
VARTGRQPIAVPPAIRDAVPGDALAVAAVHVRAWQVSYRGLLPDEHLDGLRSEQRAAGYVFDSPDPDVPRTILALDGHGAVGAFATFGSSRDADAPDAGEIMALYVDPPHWGAGMGRALTAEAESRLAADGCREIVLWVLVGNEQAQGFYRTLGYVPDGGHRHEDVYGVAAEVIRYRRALP